MFLKKSEMFISIQRTSDWFVQAISMKMIKLTNFVTSIEKIRRKYRSPEITPFLKRLYLPENSRERLNRFQANVRFLYYSKISENLWFPDVFREYKNEALA